MDPFPITTHLSSIGHFQHRLSCAEKYLRQQKPSEQIEQI